MKKIKLSISGFILTFIVAISVLAISNYAVINYYQIKQKKDAALVDASGRNRMLSQKIGLYAEMLASDKEEARDILASTIRLHDTSLNSLKTGGVVPGIANDIILPKASGDVLPVLLIAEEQWKAYKKNAQIILQTEGSSIEAAKALTYIENNAPAMLTKNNMLVKAYVAENVIKQERLDLILLALLAMNLIVFAVGYIIFKKQITQPIYTIAEAAQDVAHGNFHKKLKSHSDPCISTLVDSISLMAKNIDQSAQFSASIGNGNFDFEFDKELGSNRLFEELSNMKVKLMKVAEEDKKRNWVTKGLAEFGEILRSNQDDIKKLSDDIIIKMVKYVGANQGSLFVLNEDNTDDQFMQLMACYAWDRKKFLEKRIDKGQGLIGQCWMERGVIYMTDIPSDYVSITSGLGKANPNALLIVPLVVNEEIFGIIEIATFDAFEEHEIEFVRKVGENIASTLSSAKVTSRTKLLLEESQQQSEEMRAQEEEIRQNMEEMQATQEEMERKQVEANGTMIAINSSSALIEFSPEGVIQTANEKFLETMGYSLEEIQGKHHRTFVDPAEASSFEYKNFWASLKLGEATQGEYMRIAKNGNKVWLFATYTPVKDHDGQVIKVIKLAQDITTEKLKTINYESQIDAINSSQAVIEFDLVGNILYANQIFLDTMGYRLNEIKGKHHAIFCEPEYAKSKKYQEFWKQLESGEFVQGQFTRLKKDQSEVCLKATYTPILNAEGFPYKIIKFASVIAFDSVEK